jgi:integrase
MATALNKLTDRKVQSASKPGRVSDGGGLFLRVRTANAKSWAFIYRRADMWVEVGLGGYPATTLAHAREQAQAMRETLARGGDPRAERLAGIADRKAARTFAEVVEAYFEDRGAPGQNEKHQGQWRMTLGPAYCASILSKPVADVDRADVVAILKPHWIAKAETASRLRGRIERILAYAMAKGWRPAGDNPAELRGALKELLPVRPAKATRVKHFPAMPYTQAPAFAARLRQLDSTSARTLLFQMLCASRSGEVMGAVWDEIDLEGGTWSIPGHRMKAKQPHTVPLSRQAVDLLRRQWELTGGKGYVFPGAKAGKPLSPMALTMLMRGVAPDFVPHGLRSTFRDWSGDQTNFPREVCEAALAHNVGSAVERSYRRGSALEKRKSLMQVWADFLDRAVVATGENVVTLHR